MSRNLHILIVDDDHRMAETLVDILKVKGYEAEAVYSGVEALDKIKKGKFDCVVTDIKMPEMNGLALFQAIKEVQPELTVVLMTAYAADTLVNEALQEGAIAALKKPLNINLLLSFFSFVSKETSIVIVDDDEAFCKSLGDILQLRGFAVTKVTNAHDVAKGIESDIQIVLLDMKLNGVSGLDILKEIKSRNPHQPVILVTGYREQVVSAIEKALEIGAYACLYKPLQIEELIQVLSGIRQQELGRILGQPVRKRKK